jgi:hypothetical protein
MATLASNAVPTVKVESAMDDRIKPEPEEEKYMDDVPPVDEDIKDEETKWDNKEWWMGKVSRGLWSQLIDLDALGSDEEIEIGTLRLEGRPQYPEKV